MLASIEGEWEPGVIKGKLVDAGWGAALGYPGLVIDAGGNDIRGFVFSSSDLDTKWAELDALEGSEYERLTALVALADGTEVEVYVYALRTVR